MQVEGSVGLVVGGGGGFGGATTRRLHGLGATVVVADFSEEKGKQVVAELGDRAVFAKTDVTSSESIAEAIAVAEEQGPLRFAVVAHGSAKGGGRTLGRDGSMLAQQDYMDVINIFLGATFDVLRQAAASMARNEPNEAGERGVLISTASIAAFDGTVGQAAYGAAKGGIVGMTLPLARDLAPVGIRVMTIAPGTFLTPAFGDADPEQLDAFWGNVVPFPKRMGRPPEYALLAEQIIANTYLNGETIRLDGALRFTPKGATL